MMNSGLRHGIKQTWESGQIIWLLFFYGQNECRQAQSIWEMAKMNHYNAMQSLETAEMDHYDPRHFLKRRIRKKEEARDGCRGPHHLMLSFHYHLVCQVPIPIGV